MTEFEFTVLGTPISKGSLKSYGRGRMVETVKKSAPWREHVHWAARDAWNQPPLEGPIDVTAACCFDYPKSAPKRRRVPPITRSTYDVDKLARNLLDAISKVVIKDDSQVVHLDITKHYVGDHDCPLATAGAIIRIRPHVPPPIDNDVVDAEIIGDNGQPMTAAELADHYAQLELEAPVGVIRRTGCNYAAETVNVGGGFL